MLFSVVNFILLLGVDAHTHLLAPFGDRNGQPENLASNINVLSTRRPVEADANMVYSSEAQHCIQDTQRRLQAEKWLLQLLTQDLLVCQVL